MSHVASLRNAKFGDVELILASFPQIFVKKGRRTENVQKKKKSAKRIRINETRFCRTVCVLLFSDQSRFICYYVYCIYIKKLYVSIHLLV